MYKLEITLKDSSTATVKADTYEEFQRKLDEFYIYNENKLYI
jgi:hypothetical protein